jgi:hypothetical protein
VESVYRSEQLDLRFWRRILSDQLAVLIRCRGLLARSTLRSGNLNGHIVTVGTKPQGVYFAVASKSGKRQEKKDSDRKLAGSKTTHEWQSAFDPLPIGEGISSVFVLCYRSPFEPSGDICVDGIFLLESSPHPNGKFKYQETTVNIEIEDRQIL